MPIHVITAETAPHGEFRLAPDVAVAVMEDGSARVMDMADRFYAVPRSAAVIVQGVLEGGLDAAAGRLADAYRLDEQQARSDAERFVAELLARGILVRTSEPPRRRRSFTAELLAIVMNAAVSLLPTLGLKVLVLLTLARISCARCGWAATVDAWTRRLPPVRSGTYQDLERAQLANVESAVARGASRHILGMECKERSLACWALIRARGLHAVMIIGADFYPMAGHVWCEADSRIVSDHPQNCRRYQQLLCYA